MEGVTTTTTVCIYVSRLVERFYSNDKLSERERATRHTVVLCCATCTCKCIGVVVLSLSTLCCCCSNALREKERSERDTHCTYLRCGISTPWESVCDSRIKNRQKKRRKREEKKNMKSEKRAKNRENAHLSMCVCRLLSLSEAATETAWIVYLCMCHTAVRAELCDCGVLRLDDEIFFK
jgi:hypothetical protein